MPNNSYQHFFEAQKAMFDEWQKYMKSAFKNFAPAATANFSPSEYYSKIFEATQNFWQKAFDEWQSHLKTAGTVSDFNLDSTAYYQKMAESAQEFWRKTGESYKPYSALFALWQKLSEDAGGLNKKNLMEIYEAWTKQHATLMRDSFMPNSPGYIKDFANKLMENFSTNSEVFKSYLQTSLDSGEAWQQAWQNALNKGPEGYIELLEVWQKNYNDTFGKLVNAPTFGRDMSLWQHQKAGFDRFIKYNIAITKFYTGIYEVAQDATKKVLEDYLAMSAQNAQPKTFDEFYKYWSKTVTAGYDKVLFSEHLSQLAGNMVDEMSRFKAESDKLWEMYLANFPVPRKSDMDALYKTVYDLKKELRAMKREMKSNEKPSK